MARFRAFCDSTLLFASRATLLLAIRSSTVLMLAVKGITGKTFTWDVADGEKVCDFRGRVFADKWSFHAFGAADSSDQVGFLFAGTLLPENMFLKDVPKESTLIAIRKSRRNGWSAVRGGSPQPLGGAAAKRIRQEIQRPFGNACLLVSRLTLVICSQEGHVRRHSDHRHARVRRVSGHDAHASPIGPFRTLLPLHARIQRLLSAAVLALRDLRV